MTESGGTGRAAGGGGDPAESGSTGQGGPVPDATPPPPPDLPRWQPFTDPPAAPPATPTYTPTPDEDTGSLVPDQLHDAPAYIPPPVGMTPGGVMPPPDPADIPTSAWITTAPQTAPQARGLRGNIGAIIGGIVGIVIVGAVVAGALGLLPSDKGKILFGTAAGSDLCSVGNQTTAMTSTDPVFFAAVLKHHMDGAQAITFKIDKNGTELVNHDEPADGTSFDCYGNKESLGTLEAGSYVFTVIHNGEVEATGALTVK